MAIQNDDFFEESSTEQQPQEETVETPSKIKIGDEEYDADELQRLVSLGKIGKEAEEKYNTRIDKIWPDYTKKSQALAEREKAEEERQRLNLQNRATQGEELSEEEQKRLVRDSLKKFGVVFEDEVDTRVTSTLSEREATNQLLKNIQAVVSEAKEKYQINTDERQLLTYMQAQGGEISPEQAFKKLFEPQIKSWEERELQKTKPQGLVTEGSSTAGSKQPTEVRPTRQNLADLVLESLNGGK